MLAKPDVRDIIITLWLLYVNSKEIYLCQNLLIVHTECFPPLPLKHDAKLPKKFIEPSVYTTNNFSVVWGQKSGLILSRSLPKSEKYGERKHLPFQRI